MIMPNNENRPSGITNDARWTNTSSQGYNRQIEILFNMQYFGERGPGI